MITRLHSRCKNSLGSYWYRIALWLIALLLLIACVRIGNAIKLYFQTNTNAISTVSIIHAQHSPSTEKIMLPGNVSAWYEAPIYARTNGYVKTWYVDIGDHVQAGQVLAEIETPELDASLRQAKADVETMLAKNKLAQTTAQRWKMLRKTDSVSQQETDEKVDGAAATEAALVAAKANRDRLQELVGFEKVTAPFTGIITARAIDIGDLINAGNDPNRKPLYRIAQVDPLRIYVHIPQNYAFHISKNGEVALTFPEYPGRTRSAQLINTANAIQPKTRTLLAEFQMDNPKGEIFPGDYTEVYFTFPVSPNTIKLPVNALLFRSDGLQVATVDNKNHVILKSIKVYRDFGNMVEIYDGLRPGERIVLNPYDSIQNGELVQIQGQHSRSGV